jgi:hypothetical protein
MPEKPHAVKAAHFPFGIDGARQSADHTILALIPLLIGKLEKTT